ncbi:arginine-10 [Trichoderma gamsii]|uniref:Arginine-10 n=1 Tax=Trichoderma gamsii TaxID=398673 RepID=A0A2P4ZNY7_9HYPO|nr:arginine-10 [Trichoderma gamsii]PON25995.1 arginine-10 [Trichoderma gamsii]
MRRSEPFDGQVRRKSLLGLTLLQAKCSEKHRLCPANAKSGIIIQEEFEKLESGLCEIEKDWGAGTFTTVPGVDEYVSTANELRLGEIIGKNIAGKLHTGRNRNEQAVCNMLMRFRNGLRKIGEHLVSFLNIIAARAEQEIDYVMHGYTPSAPSAHLMESLDALIRFHFYRRFREA